MLSEKCFSKPEHRINFELKTKNRRLTDIRRGQQYLRKIDSLAENQWRNNEPRIKGNRTEYASVRPITDTVYTKMKAEREMRDNRVSFVGDREYHRKRVLSERHPRSFESHEDVALDESMNGMLGYSRHGKQLGYQQLEEMRRRRNMPDRQMFNQYGSNYTALDDKLELKQRDFDPKYEPFRFRESMQRVVKPVPKKGIMMSRVGHDERERQLKINTNFRSTHNGVVRVIQPPDPWPETFSGSRYVPSGDGNIKNERTFVLLKRLDHFLNPDMKDKSSLGSSERDFPPSKSPCISDFSDAPSDYQKIREEARGPQQEVHFPENDQTRAKPIYKMYHKSIPHVPKRKNTSNHGLKEYLKELDQKPMDTIRKCRLWVNMCNSIKTVMEQDES